MQSINQSLRQTALMIFLVKRNKTILRILADSGADNPPARCQQLSAYFRASECTQKHQQERPAFLSTLGFGEALPGSELTAAAETDEDGSDDK